MQSTPRRVFLSYARADGQRFSEQLSADLLAAGHSPWRDTERLSGQGGTRWVPELTRQLLSSDVVVVVLTPGAAASLIVEGEWVKALQHGLPVVPTLFLDCGVPTPLASLQYVDFRSDPAAGLAALLDRLAGPHGGSAPTERDRQTLDALRALQAKATGLERAELDGLIRDLADRIDRHSEDVQAQTDRVARGLAEARDRAGSDGAPSREGVRRFGRRPPTAIDAFRDRAEQQEAIASALVDSRVRMVTVLGRGGMGKTALACYVLSRLEAGEWSRRGAPVLRGIVYLQHTPTQPITLDRVLLCLARVLPDDVAAKAERVFGNRDLSTDDRVDRFLDLVSEGLIVALLDNFEDLLDERGHIRDADLNLFVRRVLVSSGALKLLVTARAAINLPSAELRAERQVIVREGLPEADALALLKELDPNEQLGLGDARDEDLLKLVHLTHAIPRALELVANILKGEDDAASFLLGIEDVAKDFYTRESVVQNLVEVNYSRLRPDARRVIEALAVLGRPVPQVAIDFLLQPHVPGLRLGDVLQPLVNARLVSVERSRDGKPAQLALHPIDRDFLYQRLPTEGAYSRTALHTRAAEFYQAQRTHGPREWRDLVQLQPQLLEFEHLVQAGRFDQAAIVLGEYAGIVHVGYPTYCRDLFLKLPDRLTTDAARAHYLLTGLLWKAYLGPVGDAVRMGEQALQIAIAMEDLRLELRIRSELITGYRYAQDSQRACAHGERIEARIAETQQPLAGELATEYDPGFGLVLAYTYAGNVRRAAPLARRAYDSAVRSGNPLEMGWALNLLVVVHFACGRYAEAVRLTREADKIWGPGFNDGLAYIRNLAGMALYLLGDYPGAVSRLQDARTTADDYDSPRPEALALWNLALIHTLHGVYDRAVECGREAEVLMTRMGLGRAPNAAHLAADCAARDDHRGFVRALLDAADEWTTCADLFPGTVLAERAGQIARRYDLDNLAADADAAAERLRARLQLPDRES